MTIIHLRHTLALVIHLAKRIFQTGRTVTEITSQDVVARDNRKLTSMFEIQKLGQAPEIPHYLRKPLIEYVTVVVTSLSI